MVNARLQPEKLLSIYRKISKKVFQEHKPKQSGCSFLILSKWDVHNIQIDFRRYLLNASQKKRTDDLHLCFAIACLFHCYSIYIFIYFEEISSAVITWFSCTAAFGYQTAPEEFCSTDENLSGQFVHTGPFNIFALFKQNWGTRLNFNFCQWFCHLPLRKVLI